MLNLPPASEFYAMISMAVAPVIVMLGYIYFRDQYEKEPLGLLLLTFFAGFFSFIPILLIELTVMALMPNDPSTFFGSISSSFVSAAIPEELTKFVFLYLIIWRNKNFNEHFDGIVYAVFVSMGFACIENICYVFGNQLSGADPYSIAVIRSIVSLPCHFLCGVIMGYYFSLAKFNQGSALSFLSAGVFYAILAHGLFNTLLFFHQVPMFSSFVGILSIVFLVFNIRLWKTGIFKIRHMVQLSNPDTMASGAQKCSQCGQVYSSSDHLCTRCNTEIRSSEDQVPQEEKSA